MNNFITSDGFHVLVIVFLLWLVSLKFSGKQKQIYFWVILCAAVIYPFIKPSANVRVEPTPETPLAALAYEIGSPKAYGQIPQSDRKAHAYYLASKYKKALEIAKPAADAGEPLPQFVMAEMYFHGRGVKKDMKKSMHYFRLAANNGHVASQEILGRILFKGESVPQDDERAFAWNKLAAYNGNPLAQHTLGLQYYLGLGTGKDCEKAFSNIRKATDAHIKGSFFDFGNLYRTGCGVDLNYANAANMFETSAKKFKDKRAQHNLGLHYKTGKGRAYSLDKAQYWFKLAAQQGYEPSKKELQAIKGKS